MDCERIIKLIDTMLDGESRPEEDAAVNAHVDACLDCRRYLQLFSPL